MADTIYTVSQDDPNNIPGFENYSQSDLNLLSEYQVNNLFDTNKHFVELYITDLSGEIIEADSKYTSYKLLGNAQSAGKEGASILTINPIEDSKAYGYETGGIKLLYHFLNDLYTQDSTTSEFFITDISPDRTELQLQNLNLTNEQLVSLTSTIKDKLSSQSYYNEFRLDFGNNDLLIGINIDNLLVGENQTVVVKLYEPLPGIYEQKSTLNIVEIISDSVAFEVDATFNLPEVPANSLRPANFNLDITDDHVVPSQYFNYTELFSYPISNANSQIYSLFNEKGVEISIDHSDYSNFIHFSSAQERLMNFKYKLQLIENYSSSLSQINNATSQSVGITGSVAYYEGLTQGVVSNFDHYERFLYYESSSYAWPKSNTTRPYNNVSSSNPIAISWYTDQLTEATRFDASNYNALINTIPSFLRDDTANDNYLIFVYMIGQHFDTIWQYTQAVTDKYDGDNRLDFGISKDLVGEALKNFGVKLYTSNNSIEDLFGSFIGQAYQSGSEVINYYITGSLTGSNTPIQPSSYDNYNKEVQKRIYHNLSHLVKTKGTERGLRALINCFGIPSDILKIKLYGGRNVDERPFYGDFQYYTSSLDKIRLDHTGSLVTGSTLSSYTSIYKRDPKYTDDLHVIEVGFSPTDNVDNYIVSYSLADGSLSSFNIDDYIGDPRNLTLDSYASFNSAGTIIDTLTNLTNRIMSSSDAYNVFDYVRLIKFFDNTIFKMVRDFIPARVTADTGIIIKPHLLQRNKAKSVILSGSRTELSGSVDTAFIESSNGDTFGINDSYTTITYGDLNNPSTNYRLVQTPSGLGQDYRHGHEETKFDGDFSGSNVIVTQGNLTSANIFTTAQFTSLTYDIILVSGSANICFLQTTTPLGTPLQIFPNQPYQASTFFGAPNPSTVYTASVAGGSTVYPTFNPTYTFTNANFQQYQLITLQATASNLANCQASIQGMYASCSIRAIYSPGSIVADLDYDLVAMFTPEDNSNIEYFVTNPAGTFFPAPVPNPRSHTFPAGTYQPSTQVFIEARDRTIENYANGAFTCRARVTSTVNTTCPISLPNRILSYYFNDTGSFEVFTNETPKRYIVCNRNIDSFTQENTTPTIKSLLATGATDSNTRYYVELVNAIDGFTRYAFITPGEELRVNETLFPLSGIPNYLQWNGNEKITLKFYPGSTQSNSYWGWTIEGGAFQAYLDNNPLGAYNLWANSETRFLDSDSQSPYFLGVPTSTRLTDCAIRITAYNPDPIYNTIQSPCVSTITIDPPFVPTPSTPPCQLGLNYICVSDGRGGLIAQSPQGPGRQIVCFGTIACESGTSLG